jgi:hypothetical protein
MVDQPAKFDVAISEEIPARGSEDEKYHQSGAQQRIVGEPSGLASLPASRDLEFYGHNSMLSFVYLRGFGS